MLTLWRRCICVSVSCLGWPDEGNFLGPLRFSAAAAIIPIDLATKLPPAGLRSLDQRAETGSKLRCNSLSSSQKQFLRAQDFSHQYSFARSCFVLSSRCKSATCCPARCCLPAAYLHSTAGAVALYLVPYWSANQR